MSPTLQDMSPRPTAMAARGILRGGLVRGESRSEGGRGRRIQVGLGRILRNRVWSLGSVQG